MVFNRETNGNSRYKLGGGERMTNLKKLYIQDINYGIQEKIKNSNGVGILIDKSLKKEVEVRRIEDRIMLIELFWEKRQLT